jgi:hypothetical protein
MAITDAETAPSVTVAGPERPTTDQSRSVRRWLPRLSPTDVAVIGAFLVFGVWVTLRLWLHRGRLVNTYNDEILFEWMLSRAAQAVIHLQNPLYSNALGAPAGLNLMANTSVLGLGIPLTPITLLFGAHVSFLVGLILGLSGTATAWYLLLSRTVVSSRVAAALGAVLCGFAPGMISQATGHLHMVSQWLIPAIIWAVLRLREPGHSLRRGIVLGALLAYQVFLSEEVLSFAAIGLGLFVVLYVIFKPSAARAAWRPFLVGLGIAAGTAAVLLAYPLWFQFFGPQHYRDLPFGPDSYWTDLSTYGSYASQSAASIGHVGGAPLAPNLSEQNSFYGYALLGMCVLAAAMLWRSATAKALSVSGVLVILLASGNNLMLNGKALIPGPYLVLKHLPVVSLAVPGRFPLVLTPILAVLLALSIDRVWSAKRGTDHPVPPFRLLWAGAVVASMLPLVPRPLVTVAAPPVPKFISDGQWRQYVPPGRTIVPVVPVTGGESIWGMMWSGRTGLAFQEPGGYFIGPSSPTNPHARWSNPDTPTSLMLNDVAWTGRMPIVTDADRAQAITDLRAYRGAIVVMGELKHGQQVHVVLDELLGPGRYISGAWVWDVRPLVG